MGKTLDQVTVVDLQHLSLLCLHSLDPLEGDLQAGVRLLLQFVTFIILNFFP